MPGCRASIEWRQISNRSASDRVAKASGFSGLVQPWHIVLQPYVKSYDVFRCPSVHSPVSSAAIKSAQYWSTYGLPGIGNTATKKVIYNLGGLHLSEPTEPARTWMIVETAYNSPTHTRYLDQG